jgi:alkyl sulfatase BDS1-like metallo-beta-lactamase superfamily hydrolase
VFAAGDAPKIYAHDSTAYHVRRILNKMRPIIASRSLRMFGNHLDSKGVENAGIGPFLGLTPESTMGYLEPTETFPDTMEVEIAGIRFQLIHAPGETPDQIMVWLPDEKVLLPGDNIYWTFPNLYTIRGTAFRSLAKWYRSLDEMRDMRPEYLVPSHTHPVAGAEKIQRYLTDYRDAIQFVHDQAIRGINMGMTPDELAEKIELPPHLAGAPYLQPFYGKVSWSVRSMFSGNLGWFDGDAATLQPLGRKEEADLMVRIAGGKEALVDRTREALENGEYQAALQLSGHLLRLGDENPAAEEIRVKALLALAERDENPNARHYYLTEALEIRDGFVSRENIEPTPRQLHRFPLESYFELLSVNLDPDKSAAMDKRVAMEFPDAGKAFTIHVRRGVAEIRPRTPADLSGMDFDIHVKADAKAWKEMLGKIRNPVLTLASFEYEKGNTVSFAKFLQMFTPSTPKLAYRNISE